MTREGRTKQKLLDAISAAAHEAHIAGVPIPEIRTTLGASSYRLISAWADRRIEGQVPSPDDVQQGLTSRIAEAVDGACSLGLPIDRARAALRLQLYCLDEAAGEPGGARPFDPSRPATGAEAFVTVQPRSDA